MLSILRLFFSDTLGLLPMSMSRFKFFIDYSRDTCISLSLSGFLFWIFEKSGSTSSMSSNSTIGSQGPTFTWFTGMSSYWRALLYFALVCGFRYQIGEAFCCSSWPTISKFQLYETWLKLASGDICTISALPVDSDALTLSLDPSSRLCSKDEETSLIVSKSDNSYSLSIASIFNTYINSVLSKLSI